MNNHDDWVKEVAGPLGELHQDSAEILKMIDSGKIDKDKASTLIFKMVLDLHAVSKEVDCKQGSAQLMIKWCEGFDEILEVMKGPIGNGPCPEVTKVKMAALVDDMKKFK